MDVAAWGTVGVVVRCDYYHAYLFYLERLEFGMMRLCMQWMQWMQRWGKRMDGWVVGVLGLNECCRLGFEISVGKGI